LLSKSSLSKPKTLDTADYQLIEQLSPAILQFLQPESRSLVKSRGKATEAPVLREVSVSRQAAGQAAKQLNSQATDQVMGSGSGYRKGQTGKSTSLALRRQAGRQAASPTAGQAKEQLLKDQSPRELVRQTRSGRISVKRVVFEARRN
jgi:phosphoribosylanthranilate isomerase